MRGKFMSIVMAWSPWNKVALRLIQVMWDVQKAYNIFMRVDTVGKLNDNKSSGTYSEINIDLRVPLLAAVTAVGVMTLGSFSKFLLPLLQPALKYAWG